MIPIWILNLCENDVHDVSAWCTNICLNLTFQKGFPSNVTMSLSNIWYLELIYLLAWLLPAGTILFLSSPSVGINQEQILLGKSINNPLNHLKRVKNALLGIMYRNFLNCGYNFTSRYYWHLPLFMLVWNLRAGTIQVCG